MSKSRLKRTLLFFIAFVILVGVSACRPGSADITSTPDQGSIETQTEVPAATEAPTATTAVPAVILITSPNADPAIAAQVQSAVETLAVDSGLQVLVYDSLTPELIHTGVRIVVGVGTDLSGFAAGNPAVQFVEVARPGAVPGANLSVIGDPVVDEQRRAFMGGYLAALVSTDYKVAGLIASDISTTTEEVNAYVIGARFFCGLCNPKYPPYNSFPQWDTLPAGSAAGVFQSKAQGFINLGVEVVYISETLATPDLTGYFSDSGLKVVSGKGPDMPRENWVATVILDPAPSLIEIWPDLLAGSGGVGLPMSVGLTDTGAGLISEGRQRLFDEMLVELQAGYALPEFTP
jgi:basic membrane lipoprotein Med (substrate-binding protein (PBP1-ABC) superfamily)